MASISLFLKFHLEKNTCYNDSSRLSGRWPPESGSREPQTCVARGLQKRISCQSADPTDGLRATAVLRYEKQSSLFPNPHSPARQGGVTQDCMPVEVLQPLQGLSRLYKQTAERKRNREKRVAPPPNEAFDT
jgi:hypothetical protein